MGVSGIKAQNPNVQIIHNCADAAATNVKIWANGSVLVNNLQFRYATAASTLSPGSYTIGVSLPTATNQNQSLAQFTVSFLSGVNYYVTANGIVSGMGYNPNNTQAPFTLSTYTISQMNALPGAGQTQVLVHHGCTDAPTVDVVAPFSGTNPVIPNALVNNAAYTNYSNLLTLNVANYNLQIRDQNSENVVAEYLAPLQSLGLGGSRICVVASGFLVPGNNSSGPAFGLWVATSAGGSLIPLPTTTVTSTRAQAIHNCADAAANSVDVWLRSATTGTTGLLLADNFNFRKATPYVDLPVGQTITLSIAPPTSTSPVGALANFTYNLSASSKYQLIASGIVSPIGYTPSNTVTPFNLIVNANVRERSLNSINTDVLVFHGATDAPAVNVLAVGAGTIVNNMAYGTFNGAGYLQLASNTPSGNYTLHVTNTAGTSTVASYLAPLNTLSLSGSAITVLASGFLNPSNNSNGAAFGLWAALPAGGSLVQLPTYNITSISEANELLSSIIVYPNPFVSQLTIQNSEKISLSLSIRDVGGKLVTFVNGSDPQININTENLPAGVYIVTLSGNNANQTYKLIK